MEVGGGGEGRGGEMTTMPAQTMATLGRTPMPSLPRTALEHCQNKSIGFMLFLEFLFAVLLLCRRRRRRQEASVWPVGWLQQHQQQRQLVVA